MSTIRIFSDIARRRNDGVAAGQPVTRLHVNRELRLRTDGRETIPESAFFSCWRQEDADGTRGTKRKCSIRYCGLRIRYTYRQLFALKVLRRRFRSFTFHFLSLTIDPYRSVLSGAHTARTKCVSVSACASVSSQWPI